MVLFIIIKFFKKNVLLGRYYGRVVIFNYRVNHRFFPFNGRMSVILGLASNIYLSLNTKIEFPKAERDVKEEKKEKTTKENVQETPITPIEIEDLEKKVEENTSEGSNINVNNNHQNIVVTPWFQTFFPFKQRGNLVSQNHRRGVTSKIVVVEEPMIPQTPKIPQPIIVKIKDVQSNEMTTIKTHLMNCGFATEDVNSAIQKLEKNKENIDVSSIINEISQIHSIFPLASLGEVVSNGSMLKKLDIIHYIK